MLAKNLQAVSDQSLVLTHARQEKSATAYQSALEAFRVAAACEFRQPQAVAEACRQLGQAIRFHPSQAEPYAALAYLLWLFGRESEASACLRTALIHDPGLEMARQVQTLIQSQAPARPAAEGPRAVAVRLSPLPQRPASLSERASAQPSDLALTLPDPLPAAPVGTSSAAQPPAGSDEDPEALAEQIEARIHQEVRAMLHQPVFKASADPGLSASLRAHQDALGQTYALLCAQIESLEQELETGPLLARLKPIEMRLKQFQHLATACEIFAGLEQAIDRELSQAEGQISRLEQDASAAGAIQAGLDRILDTCDAFADQLDELERKGHDIEPLTQKYTRLVQQIEQVQDLLEEAQERSSP